jgi:hypothetical protein
MQAASNNAIKKISPETVESSNLAVLIHVRQKTVEATLGDGTAFECDAKGSFFYADVAF